MLPLLKLEPRAETPMRAPAELLTLEQLAGLWQISAKKLRRACGNRHSDPLPCIRLGHSIRFNLSDPRLAAWLDRRTQGAAL